MLKLKPAPKDPKTKIGFSLKQSTIDELRAYAAAYVRNYSDEIALDDLVDQMLAAFMRADRAFQRERSVASRAGKLQPPAPARGGAGSALANGAHGTNGTNGAHANGRVAAASSRL